MSAALTPLQKFVFLNVRMFAYAASTPGLPLSVKTVSNGRVLYKLDSKEVAIDDDGYLIINNRQPYKIEISSPTLAESFIVRFPDGWAEEVYRSTTAPVDELLSTPDDRKTQTFFPTYTRHDANVSPLVAALRRKFQAGQIPDDDWLEEQLRLLLYAMWKSERGLERSVLRIAALRATTRNEVWKRVSRARDYLHSRYSTAVTLSEAATVACLSPFHFLRSFHAAFGVTPHQYLTQCRVNRAKFLLERTDLPLSDVALDSGFATSAAFSTIFGKETGVSPRRWRRQRLFVPPQNRKIRKELLRSRL